MKDGMEEIIKISKKLYSFFIKETKPFKETRLNFIQLFNRSKKLKWNNGYNSWLDNLSKRWRNEQPPLEWYAAAITCHYCLESIPHAYSLKLASASNFYGDPELAIYSVRKITIKDGPLIYFEALKYKAKAYRILGEFVTSRNVLQEAISILYEANLQGELAYCFILFSNLCSDYLQRKGWFKACNEIAHGRIQKEQRDGIKKNIYDRWLQITEHRLGSLIYNYDQATGEDFFKKALSRKLYKESRFRIEDSLFGLRVDNKLNRGIFDDLSTELDDYLKLIEEAIRLGNDRSIMARKIHFLETARNIVIYYIDNGRPLENLLLTNLLEGGAKAEANRIENIAYRYSDRKIQSKAALGQARWLILKSKTLPTNERDKFIKESITILLRARTILTEKEKISDTYLEVLRDLGSAHYLVRDFEKSLFYLNESYSYCKELLTELKRDEKEVDVALKKKIESIFELKVLNKQELEGLKSGMDIDYRLLLNSSLALAELLIKSQSALLQQETVESLKFARGFKYHNLSQRLNSVQKNINDVVIGIKDFHDTIDDWRDQEDYMWNYHEINILDEIEKLVNKRNMFNDDNRIINITPPKKGNIIILFNHAIFHHILDHFIYNAESVGTYLGKQDWELSIGVSEKNGIAYLLLIDNLGSFNRYRKIIDSINIDAIRVESIKGAKGGRGLVYVRDYIKRINKISNKTACQFEYTWNLYKLDKSLKQLEVPIGRIKG